MEIKKFAVIVMMLVCGISLFANGQADQSNNRQDQIKDLIESGEKVVLTGTLVLDNRVMPELTVGDVVYRLMVPRHLVLDMDIEDGEEVSIEGVLVTPDQKTFPGCKRFSADAKAVIVLKATIKGKTYDLEDQYGKMGSRKQMGKRKGPFLGDSTDQE